MKGRKRIILCVDDNVEVLQSLRRELRETLRGEARVQLATSAEAALKQIAAMEVLERLGLIIISDWLMPGMRGDEFVAQLRDEFGEIPVIVLSGHITSDAFSNLEAYDHVRAILPKPWRASDLENHVNQVLDDRGESDG